MKKYINISSFALTFTFIYLLINYLIVSGTYSSYTNISLFIRLFLFVFLPFFLLFFFHIEKVKFFIPNFFIIIFLIFSYLNTKRVNSDYFWLSIPDARTYKTLGLEFLKCFQLTLQCNSEPYLLFPPFQPILSGLLAKYLYEYAFLVNILFIAIVIFLVNKITENYFGVFSGIGLSYILIHSLIYELSPMMISEITFTLLIFLSLYFLLKNTDKSLIVNITYMLSLITRPIGIVLLPMYLYFVKNKLKFMFYLFLFIFVICSYNFFYNDNFLFSDTEVNAREDAILENQGYFDYFTKIIFSSYDEKVEIVTYFSENLERLYGESSKACVFTEICNVYNPINNFDGTQSAFFINSNSGNYISKFLTVIYQLQAPQNFGILILPTTLILSLILFRNKKLIIFPIAIISLIFPSILTTEFGSRWNFTILFLTGAIIEFISCSYLNKKR